MTIVPSTKWPNLKTKKRSNCVVTCKKKFGMIAFRLISVDRLQMTSLMYFVFICRTTTETTAAAVKLSSRRVGPCLKNLEQIISITNDNFFFLRGLKYHTGTDTKKQDSFTQLQKYFCFCRIVWLYSVTLYYNFY